jgi:hypothetical protein
MSILHETQALLETLLATNPSDPAAVDTALRTIHAQTKLMHAIAHLVDAARRADVALSTLPADTTGLLDDVTQYLRNGRML